MRHLIGFHLYLDQLVNENSFRAFSVGKSRYVYNKCKFLSNKTEYFSSDNKVIHVSFPLYVHWAGCRGALIFLGNIFDSTDIYSSDVQVNSYPSRFSRRVVKPPWVFVVIQYVEKISPLVDSLLCALHERVNIMGYGAVGGL